MKKLIFLSVLIISLGSLFGQTQYSIIQPWGNYSNPTFSYNLIVRGTIKAEGQMGLGYTGVPGTYSIPGFFSIKSTDSTSSSRALSIVNGRGDTLFIVRNDGTFSPQIKSGTYTPSLTNVSNVAASTAFQCQYMRVGNVVTVSGKVSIDPTTTLTLTQLGISLPVVSNLTSAQNCGGTANASAVAGSAGAVLGDATNDRAEVDLVPTDVTNQPFYFTFTYIVQ